MVSCPNLSFQSIDLFLGFDRLRRRPVFKDFRQPLGHLTFPLADLGRVDLIFPCDLRHRFDPAQGFQSDLGFPSSATAATRRADCNRDGPPPFAAASG